MQQPVELLARIYERFNGGELELSLFHPEVRLLQSERVAGTAGAFSGHEGLRQAWDELLEGFEEVRFEPEEYTELQGAMVLVRTRWVGRGRVSGIPVDAPVWHLWEFRDGLAALLEVHASESAALRSAGYPS